MTIVDHISSVVHNEEEIKFGVERVTHLYKNDLYYAHLSIYAFAQQFAQAANVLDAGSGGGYGTAYLAEHGARMVCGIEVSPEVVSFSRQHFQRPNLEYRLMDLQAIAGFDDRIFDLLFSSNVIEHVPNVMRFFHGAWRVLSQEGVMVLAVPPITSIELQADNLANPYHLNIWSPRQWHAVLRRFFATIDCYTHLPKPGTALDFGNAPAQAIVREHDFEFTPVSIDELHYKPTLTAIFVARTPLPEHDLPPSDAAVHIVDDSFTLPDGDITARMQAAQRLLARTDDVRRLLAAFSAGDKAPQSVDVLARLHILDQHLAVKNAHIAHLERLIKQIERGKVMRLLALLQRIRSRR